jgi:anti-sigma factor RsiW
MSEPQQGDCVNDCRELEPVLAAYVDGEAAAGDGDRVRAHVDACGACRERLTAQRVARAAMHARRERLRVPAPGALKARCAAHAAQRQVHLAAAAASTAGATIRSFPRPMAFVRRWAPVSVAATFVLAMATVFGLGLNDKVQALAVQTTIDHVTCSRFKSASSDIDPVAAARRWQATTGWPITVPASSEPGRLQLQAVRRCLVTDGSVAHLLYSWMGEPLSVFVLPKRTIGDATAVARRFRHNTVMWSQNDRTYIMVTPRPQDASLDKVVAYVRAHAY